METEVIETVKSEPEVDPHVSVAVGLALLRTSLDRDKYVADRYGNALLDSPYAMSLIEEIPKAYFGGGFLEGLIREILRAQGQTEDESESADVTALVAAAEKEVQDFLEDDDLFELLQFAKYMFSAGRLSCKAETRGL